MDGFLCYYHFYRKYDEKYTKHPIDPYMKFCEVCPESLVAHHVGKHSIPGHNSDDHSESVSQHDPP